MLILIGYTFYVFLLVIFPPVRLESAIIVSGGYDGYDDGSLSGPGRSVEILRENGSYWCSLPDFPHARYSHTQSGLEACGGIGSCDTGECLVSTCMSFSSGEWRTSHKLQMEGRYGHSAWQSQQGLMLLGGQGGFFSDSETTSEILLEDGQSLPFFLMNFTVLVLYFRV